MNVDRSKGRLYKMKRTTHRSSKGKKLYAVRSKDGKFKDIQSYKKAHGADLKRSSKAERDLKKRREVFED